MRDRFFSCSRVWYWAGTLQSVLVCAAFLAACVVGAFYQGRSNISESGLLRIHHFDGATGSGAAEMEQASSSSSNGQSHVCAGGLRDEIGWAAMSRGS